MRVTSDRSRVQKVWHAMICRCHKQTDVSFENYGGRGILVCESWHSFDNFLADMGICPIGLSLERLDNSKGYFPGNCAWRSRTEQNRNKRNNRLLALDGEIKPLVDWAEKYGISASCVRRRMDVQHMGLYQALTTPKRYKVWRYSALKSA